MLQAEFVSLEHAQTGHQVIRLTPGTHYTLPSSVAHAVDFVAPAVGLPPLSALRRVSSGQRKILDHTEDKGDAEEIVQDAENGLFVTPKSLRSLYNVNDAEGSASAQEGSKLAVTGFLNQMFAPLDLKEFHTLFTRSLSAPNMTCASAGDNCQGARGGVESMLDAEYATALGSGMCAHAYMGQ